MAPAASDRTIINPELLRREAQLALTRQPGWVAFGLSVPLAIALYTLLRHWNVYAAARNLMQAALFFAGWNILYSTVYICIHWLHKQHDTVELEQRHLPLAPLHFAVRRVMLMALVPLTTSALGLLMWGVLLLFYQRPYGNDFDDSWVWHVLYDNHLVTSPWWPQMGWLVLAILSGTLLVCALGAWLEVLIANRFLRGLLLLIVPAGLYFFEKLLVYGGFGPDYFPSYGFYPGGMGGGKMLMNYHESRGVSPWPYLILLLLAVAMPLLLAWLPRRFVFVLLTLPVIAVTLVMVRPMVPRRIKLMIRPVSTRLLGVDSRYAAALFAGHLDPPENVRLLAYSFPSNILFHGRVVSPSPGEFPERTGVPPEPPYPSQGYDSPEYRKYEADYAAWQKKYRVQLDAYDKATTDWYNADAAYEKQKEHWPRVYMWVTAGLYPFLFPLWAIAAMLLGVHLQGDRARAG